jgi:hypothetical protein
VGLIGTALQLVGEGLYNYFNLDELQKWLQASAWGKANLQRSLAEDWSALARVVQQPTCELVREGERTYVQLRLPGVRTREMDSRQLHLQAYRQTRDLNRPRPHSRQLPPARWQECSAAWAAVAVVASQEEEALTLHLPIGKGIQKWDFALAINIGYQLEPGRDLLHRTCFVLSDLRIATVRGYVCRPRADSSLSRGQLAPRYGRCPLLVVHPRRNGDGRCLANCSNEKQTGNHQAGTGHSQSAAQRRGAAGSGLE